MHTKYFSSAFFPHFQSEKRGNGNNNDVGTKLGNDNSLQCHYFLSLIAQLPPQDLNGFHFSFFFFFSNATKATTILNELLKAATFLTSLVLILLAVSSGLSRKKKENFLTSHFLVRSTGVFFAFPP